MYSTELYARLGEETGRDPGWRGVGGLRVATTPERQAELERAAGTATTYGLELDLLSPAQTRERLGLLNVDDLTGSAWMPGDGYVDPELLALALADGARRQGVAVHEHTDCHRDRREQRPCDRRADRPRPRRRRGRRDRGGRGHGGGGCDGGRRHPDHADAPPVRRHRAAGRRTSRASPLCATPTTSCTSARTTRAACWWAVTAREPVTWDTDAPLSRGAHHVRAGHGAVRRVVGGRAQPRAGAALAGAGEGGERARGVHPGRRLHPGRDRGPRAVDGSGVLRPRAGGRGRRRQGHGRMDHRRPARVRHGLDGHPPLRGALRLALLRAHARAECLLALLRHRLPPPGVRRRPPAAPVTRLPAAGGAGGVVRREGRAGSG